MSRFVSRCKKFLPSIWNFDCFAFNIMTVGDTIHQQWMKLVLLWWEMDTMEVAQIGTLLSSDDKTEASSVFLPCTRHTHLFITCYFFLMVGKARPQQSLYEGLSMTEKVVNLM